MNDSIRKHNIRKRIAVVVPKYGLVGGGEKFVYELTERLAQDYPWEIHVFANRWRSPSAEIHFHHVPILSFPKFLGPLSFAQFVQNKIRRLDIDLIHTHERILNAHIYSVHGIPHPIWVKQIRGKSHMSLFDLSLSSLERKLVNSINCKHLLAVSKITAECMQHAFHNISNRMRILPPGIDLSPFGKLSRQACRQSLLQEFGWRQSDRIFLFVGMNFEIKGLDQILKAISLVNRSRPPFKIRLIVVGKGNSRKYSQMAEDLSIKDDVAFTGVIESNIERFYMGSDAFIMLSLFDTFGLVVLEAMAAGLPVVISQNVGAKDIVRDGRTGYIVDSKNISSVVNSIEQLNQSDNLHLMRKEALKDVQLYTWDVTAQKVSNIYRQSLYPPSIGT